MERWAQPEENPRSDIVKLLLYELNTAISPREERIAALKAFLEECNHDDPAKHDEELDQQADMILFQKLAYIFTIRKSDQEVGLLTCALEMVYRASRKRVALSFTEIGSVTLPLFVEMIRCDRDCDTHSRDEAGISQKEMYRDNSDLDVVLPHIEENNISSPVHQDCNSIQKGETSTQCTGSVDSESVVSSTSRMVRFADSIEDVQLERKKKCSTNKLAVRKILRVLRYYSRVLSAMKPMAHHPGLLDALIFQLQHGQYQYKKSPLSSGTVDSPINGEIDDGDMSNGRGSQEESYNDGTSSVRPSQQLNAIDSARIDVIATIVNLACADENKSKLLYHAGFLEAVIDVARDDSIDEAQEHAAIILMNLALADANKVFMSCQGGLLNVLVQLMGGAKSPHTRRYASTTIFSLASAPSNTQRIGEFADGRILSALVQVLKNDDVEEVRINSAETLFNMARNQFLSRNEDDKANDDEDLHNILGNHPDILPTLGESVISDYSADVRAYCARTLEWLAADIHHPSSCHSRVLDALATAASWTKTSCIAEAMKTQSEIDINIKVMVEHTGILDALANLASLDGINDDEVRDCALVAIGRLTTEESTRGIMAAHEGIMTALTKASFQGSGVLEGFGDESTNANRLTKAALKNLAEMI